MTLNDLRMKFLRYDYTIWRYTAGEDEAILLEDYGRFGTKKLAFKVAKQVKKEMVRKEDIIVVRKIPIKLPDTEYVDCEEWIIE